MKLLVLVLLGLVVAVSSVCNPQVNPNIPISDQCGRELGPGIAEALGSIMAAMPLADMVDMFFWYVVNDAEVNAFFNYLTSPEFHSILEAVRYMPEFIDFMEYLCIELKLDAYMYLNALGEVLGVRPITRPPGHPRVALSAANSGPGVRGMVDTIKSMIPSEEISEIFHCNVDNNPYFCQGWRKLSHPNFKAMVYKIEFHPEFINFLSKLDAWGIQTYQAMQDLKDFLWDSDWC